MRTVALIDPWWVGHHPSFYRMYCRALLDLGCRVVAFCPEPELVEQWNPEETAAGRLSTGKLTDEVQRHRWIRKVRQLAGAFRYKQQAAQLARWETGSGCRIDLVFFACLYDGVAPLGGMDAVFPYRWTSLLLDSVSIRLRNGPARWRSQRSFDPLAIFRARGCISLASLDRFICAELSRRTDKPVHWLPEAVGTTLPPRTNSALAAAINAQAAGRPVIGGFGQFARRKGALGFLRLAAACGDEPWFFVWAGELEARSFSASELRWIKAFLAAPPPNCRVELGRLADESEFDALVALSSVVYLRYRQHPGSSNVISKAVAFEKPVLVSEGFCMADQTRFYDLGLCVPEDDTTAAHGALRQLLATDAKLPRPRFAEYRASHSSAMFTETIRRMIDGLEPAAHSPGG